MSRLLQPGSEVKQFVTKQRRGGEPDLALRSSPHRRRLPAIAQVTASANHVPRGTSRSTHVPSDTPECRRKIDNTHKWTSVEARPCSWPPHREIAFARKVPPVPSPAGVGSADNCQCRPWQHYQRTANRRPKRKCNRPGPPRVPRLTPRRCLSPPSQGIREHTAVAPNPAATCFVASRLGLKSPLRPKAVAEYPTGPQPVNP